MWTFARVCPRISVIILMKIYVYMDRRKKLQIDQLDKRISYFIKSLPLPADGWIAAIRQTLGMSMAKLGKKLNKRPTAIAQMQKREQDGSITLNSLREVAAGMGMKVVYAFVPVMDESLNDYIERIAEQKAKEIVTRSSTTMILEAQETSDARQIAAIQEIKEELINDLTKIWD